MPLQATTGAASYDAFGGGAVGATNYIEDVFSTWLYTGNGTTQTITNGINLASNGGMVWAKSRNEPYNHELFDTARGTNSALISNLPVQQNLYGPYAYNSNGFGYGPAYTGNANYNSTSYTSWTFRKKAKFFDVVLYTGDGTNTRAITHNLASTPGCIIVKAVSSDLAWGVQHRSLAANQYLVLNDTAAASTALNPWSIRPTSTEFYVNGTAPSLSNGNGIQYVAYLFAHDAGGFGLLGTDNVISCGSYTGNGSLTGPVITLGYEPQWLLIKNANSTSNWQIIDTMRGMPVDLADSTLQANLSDAESSVNYVRPTSTGFQITSTSSEVNTSINTYIYIAIRRSPMKVPETGTSVFEHFTYIGDNTNPRFIPGSFPVDTALTANINSTASKFLSVNRLTGNNYVSTSEAVAQIVNVNTFPENTFSSRQAGLNIGSNQNSSVFTYLNYFFRRAPQFFDVVCYTGNGATNQVLNHNLGVAPEFVVSKGRSAVSNWVVGHSLTSTTLYGNIINSSGGQASFGPIAYTANSWLLNAVSTATTITIAGSGSGSNDSGATYFAYLFATCPGVSKVGSFTGTGATQVINCGFTGGARFILIKATSTTGNWLVWDTARSIGPSAEPYLTLNTSAAQVNGTDWVDPAASGFELSNAVGNLANTNGVSYIFLAIA